MHCTQLYRESGLWCSLWHFLWHILYTAGLLDTHTHQTKKHTHHIQKHTHARHITGQPQIGTYYRERHALFMWCVCTHTHTHTHTEQSPSPRLGEWLGLPDLHSSRYVYRQRGDEISLSLLLSPLSVPYPVFFLVPVHCLLDTHTHTDTHSGGGEAAMISWPECHHAADETGIVREKLLYICLTDFRARRD